MLKLFDNLDDAIEMRVLIADDTKRRIQTFRQSFIGSVVDIADTPSSAISTLQSITVDGISGYDYVFLDYDFDETLLGLPGNGREITRYIKKHPVQFISTKFVIHSLNPNGRWKMAKDLEGAGLKFVVWPHGYQQATLENIDDEFARRVVLDYKEQERNRRRLVEGEDFIMENGLMVLSEKFLRDRGFCCVNSCRNCPWRPK